MPVYLDSFYIISMLVMLPGLLIATWAQARVSYNYSKFSRVQSANCVTGAEVARQLLNNKGLTHIAVQHISGELTDHYDPRSKVVRLSDNVFNSTSLAAVAVAAHECGHAIQDAEEYKPMRLRSLIAPAASFATQASWMILFAGLILGYYKFAMLGVYVFAVVVVFQLVTLPVELNASSRALYMLEGEGILQREEIPNAKKMLAAAAMTYVAALINAILSIIRFLLTIVTYRRNRW